MTVVVSQRKYLWPARHFASSNINPNAPPMGLRFRLKATVDISMLPPAAKIIAIALKKYGTMVADNGGNWYISGAPDDRMPDDEINALKVLKGSDFEAVLTVDAGGNPIKPGPSAGIDIRPKSKLPGQSLVNQPWFDLLGRNFNFASPWVFSKLR